MDHHTTSSTPKSHNHLSIIFDNGWGPHMNRNMNNNKHIYSSLQVGIKGGIVCWYIKSQNLIVGCG